MSSKVLKLLALAGLLGASVACSTESDVEITFYGYPDNDPPSADIAYDCGRGYTAGGTGTYDDPLTFATAPGEFKKCEIVYLPYLRKYLRFEDTCAQCSKYPHARSVPPLTETATDYDNGKLHIDIWTGSTTSSGGDTQIHCEDSLTPDDSQTVIINPGTSYTVNSDELFASGKCYTSNVYSNADASSYCSSGSSGSSSSSGSGSSSSSSCSWSGHCAGKTPSLVCASCYTDPWCSGASCSTENDCSDNLTCQSGKCA
ncbi:uncharacterized protein BO96DRAFT_436151 [Aspergillus niger CBS 101883]|uniref:Contig An16c0020, genomic contig n=2 Tax=Aspergillus niger TaxID=5061 RepID=A2R6N9_ASPNC|nr:uncharacterized protein BO96DRAFT_436151 [Aspergillus niger CBS 101883]XP_059604739.1 uncharacterized protein An16g00670 [Aspergillus niger]PYH54531.1 hypothetical protein BO96DRAFT_436151 [Aspergillus niger CBS 101883]CAK46754.1 unnamed protein product [Aspergillus niger]